MSSVEDFLHDQQFEELDELDADAEEALLADNDEANEKNSFEVEYVDDEGNPVDIGEHDDVEVFELTGPNEDGQRNFDDVLDLEVDDDLEFQNPPEAGGGHRQDETRRLTANTFPDKDGSREEKGPDADPGPLQEEDESRVASDSDEDEDEEEGALRGRFRSERANVVSLAGVKRRADIPDSLDSIVVNADVAKGHSRARTADRRRPNSYGPNGGTALLPVPVPLLSLPFQQPQQSTGHRQPYRETKDQWAGGDNGQGSRKILINPHFKGGSPTRQGTNPQQRQPASYDAFPRQPILPMPQPLGPQQQHHHQQYAAPYIQHPQPPHPPPPQQPQVHAQSYSHHGFSSDQQTQMQPAMVPNPAVGHPLLLHPSVSQPPPNFQRPQYNVPPPPPPHATAFNPAASPYQPQPQPMGNYAPPQAYQAQRMPTVVQGPQQMPQQQGHQHHHLQQQQQQQQPQFNQYQSTWNREMTPAADTKLLQNEPWRYGVPGPGPLPPHQLAAHQPQPPRPSVLGWQLGPPSMPQLQASLQQPPPPRHPPPPPPLPTPQVQRPQHYGFQSQQQYRAQGPLQPQRQFPNQNARMQSSFIRRQNMMPMNPQGSGPVLRLVSPVPTLDTLRKRQQQQQQQLVRKEPPLVVTRKRPMAGSTIQQQTLPSKVAKPMDVAVGQEGGPQGVKSRVGPQRLAQSTVGQAPDAEEEEDEEMKAYRAKIEMQKQKREEMLRVKELRRQKMAEQRRRELQQRSEGADPERAATTRTLLPLPVSQIPSLSPPNAMVKKRVFLVRKLSASSPSGPSNVTNSGLRTVANVFTPAHNLAPKPIPSQGSRIVTLQSLPNASSSSEPVVGPMPKKNFQPHVISTIAKKTTVLVENLAQATTGEHLKKLCSAIGPVESVRLNKVRRVAEIVFPKLSDAQTFVSKYQRRMVDLSVINISVV